jgi:integrase/recombinase XerD
MPGKAKILSSQEIQSVFKLLDSKRDRALFAIGLYTGLRVSEIISLEQDQIFTADGGVRYKLVLKRLKKKNTVYSEIPLHPKLRQALTAYKEKLDYGQWLFPSRRSEKGHMVRGQAHNILTKAFALLKEEGAKTHSMRRTFLTNLSRAGIPLRTIQEMSGHSSLAQLQEYLDVDPADKLRAISQLKY